MMQQMKKAASQRRKRSQGRSFPPSPAGRGRPAAVRNRPGARAETGERAREDQGQQGERLQKVLARAGLGSRRHCEELIVQGRVQVDRQVVTELGVRVDANQQEIRVDGEPIQLPGLVYFIVNKPQGVVCTHRDPAGRARVIDLLPATRERLFTVGRLDRMSEGLLLVTNDGPLANLLAHPRYGVPKTYLVQVAGKPEPESLQRLRQGVRLAEGVARCSSIRWLRHHKNSTLLEIVLTEGKNREIRRVLAKVGHKVMWLKRIALGPLRLGNLAPGAYRRLRDDELRQLRAFVQRRGRRPAAFVPGMAEPLDPSMAAASSQPLDVAARTVSDARPGTAGQRASATSSAGPARASGGKAARRAKREQHVQPPGPAAGAAQVGCGVAPAEVPRAETP